MANETFTRTKCDRAGCNEVVERPGALDTLPEGWAKMTLMFGRDGDDREIVIGPKCLAIINPPPRKPRADKGVPAPQRSPKFEPLVGQERLTTSKEGECTTETPESAMKIRELHHLPCPGCHIDQRKNAF